MPASASPPPSPPVRTPGQQPSHPASATNRSRTPQNDRFALYSPRNLDRRWIRAKALKGGSGRGGPRVADLTRDTVNNVLNAVSGLPYNHGPAPVAAARREQHHDGSDEGDPLHNNRLPQFVAVACVREGCAPQSWPLGCCSRLRTVDQLEVETFTGSVGHALYTMPARQFPPAFGFHECDRLGFSCSILAVDTREIFLREGRGTMRALSLVPFFAVAHAILSMKRADDFAEETYQYATTPRPDQGGTTAVITSARLVIAR